MAGEETISSHLAGVGEPGPGGRRGRLPCRCLVRGRRREGSEGTVESDLLEGFGGLFGAFAGVDDPWIAEKGLESPGALGVVQGAQRRAAGIGEPSVRVVDP